MNLITEDMLKFDVTVYENLEPVNNLLSKSRVRIFYKYFNRNRTYITDDFANQLIASLPYVPIKGIFDKDDMDFTDHGEKRTEGKIYGVVPENPNVAWEEHLDEDGVTRLYCCADVLLFTGIYPEAKLIVGKPQSMELNKSTLEGEWRTWEQDGKPYCYFLKGELLGLSVLGEEVEPCFEGAAFYSLKEDMNRLFSYIKEYEKQEERKMDKNIFRLSDSAKHDLLYHGITEKGYSDFWIIDVFDDYCIMFDYNAQKYLRAYYTKDDSAETVSIDNFTECFIVDVTETEKKALEAMKAIDSYEEFYNKAKASEAQIEEYKATEEALRNSITELNTQIETANATHETATAEFNTRVEELTNTNNALTEEIDTYKNTISEKEAEIVRLNSSLADINSEKSELEQFKLDAENEKKQAILDEFASLLSEEQSNTFAEKMAEYTVEDYKKEVCFAAYNSNPSMFSKKDSKETNSDLIYKNTNKDMDSGVLKLLNRHRGGNK